MHVGRVLGASCEYQWADGFVTVQLLAVLFWRSDFSRGAFWKTKILVVFQHIRQDTYVDTVEEGVGQCSRWLRLFFGKRFLLPQFASPIHLSLSLSGRLLGKVASITTRLQTGQQLLRGMCNRHQKLDEGAGDFSIFFVLLHCRMEIYSVLLKKNTTTHKGATKQDALSQVTQPTQAIISPPYIFFSILQWQSTHPR